MTDPAQTNALPATVQRFCSILLERGLVSRAQLDEAQLTPPVPGSSQEFANRLVERGHLSDETATEVLAHLAGRTFVTLEPSMIDAESLAVLPRSFMEEANVLPVTLGDDRLVVAAERFADLVMIREIAKRCGLGVVVLAATGENIRETRRAVLGENPTSPDAGSGADEEEESLDRLFLDFDAEQLNVIEHQEEEADLEASASESPVISLVNQIIKSAVRSSASDIHIEPAESMFSVRFRVDGELVGFAEPPLRLLPAVVSRIKIMSQLDISERRLPQDGAISVTFGERSVDLRVSTMPARFGEKVVIRIIERDERARTFESLGVLPGMLGELCHVLHQPNGIFLVTGPTGSGKTSTLYAALDELVTGKNNVSTIEDPVERVLPGVNQFQVHAKAGFSFPGALRAMLRQDPDIIMVGEIRDSETAKLATEAALTGHLVLSTLHTNDAATSIPRLIHMGVEPYLVAATLRGVLAQRLVRRNCPGCNAPHPLSEAEEAFLCAVGHPPAPGAAFSQGIGCPSCEERGTRGRIGVFEFLALDELKLFALIRSLDRGTMGGRDVSLAPAFVSDGIDKAAQGLITVASLMQIVTTHARPEDRRRIETAPYTPEEHAA